MSVEQPSILFGRDQSMMLSLSPTVPSVYFLTVANWYKAPVKILASLFRGGMTFLGLILAAPVLNGSPACDCWTLSSWQVMQPDSDIADSGKSRIVLYCVKRSMSISVAVLRPVTNLRHQGWRRVFWEGSKFFKLCPIIFNYAQQIFPGGTKRFAGGAKPPWTPLVTGLAELPQVSKIHC